MGAHYHDLVTAQVSKRRSMFTCGACQRDADGLFLWAMAVSMIYNTGISQQEALSGNPSDVEAGFFMCGLKIGIFKFVFDWQCRCVKKLGIIITKKRSTKMKKYFQHLFVFTLFALIVTGCANTGNRSMRDVTEDQIRSQIVIGQTTKDQIQAMFGSPIESTYTDGGLLIWTYRYDDVTALTPETVASTVFTFGLIGTRSRGTRNELVVLFDENDVVRRFNMSNSPIETGTGVF